MSSTRTSVRPCDMVPHNILAVKLEKQGFGGGTIQRLWNHLHGGIQRVAVNGSIPSWRSRTSGVPQGSILGLLLFNIFINDVARSTEGTCKKFAEDIKLNGAADTVEGRDAT